MAKVRGFLEIHRKKPLQRPVAERLADFAEIDLPLTDAQLGDQASRCMDCGIPFCHGGCPLGNLIPDWNDLVHHERLADASAALHGTNNFPEITGRVCPAPCETSCVLGIEVPQPVPGDGVTQQALFEGPVTIKAIEREIADRAWKTGALLPQPALYRTNRRVAVIGSGPAGLAAAQQLARQGHDVTVYEKDDRLGGLLRYGIPDFKLDKRMLDQRLEQMRAEGVQFRCGVEVGTALPLERLRSEHHAVVLCGGAAQPRDLAVAGRELQGIHVAMEFLTQQNRRLAGDAVLEGIWATGKRVVVLGGGDTGSDCVGTALRQGAADVLSLELLPQPPEQRTAAHLWPGWPFVRTTSTSHEEGGQRAYGVRTRKLLGRNGQLRAIEAVRVQLQGGKLVDVPDSTFEIPCDLLLLAMGFVGPVRTGLLEQLGVALDARGNIAAPDGCTSVPGVFAAGDAVRGASLVVWAIAEGRKVAERVDAFLAAPDFDAPSFRAAP